MKKMFYIGLLALALCSCSKEEVDTTPKEVEVKLDYTFAESGSMTRAGADMYGAFYDRYIKTKKLTPTTYKLTFTNKQTGTVAQINGLWNSQDGIRLVEGEYEVSGTSHPKEKRTSLGYPSDSVYLAFNETVNISKDATVLTLNAKYDSYLLMFDKANYSSVTYEVFNTGGPKNLLESESLLTLFIKDLKHGTTSSYDHYIYLTRSNGQKSEILLNNIPFEKGKYYYFNDMTNSFDIPPMDSGN